MKKIVLMLLCIAVLSLSGCATEPDETFLVSAIYFENKSGEFLVTAEYICVSDTDEKAGYTAKTTSVKADRAAYAINRLSGSMTKKLSFDHCAIVILNQNLSVWQTEEIFKFLKEGEISLSAQIVSTDTPDVFSAKTNSNPSVGYALASLLKSREKLFGYGVHTKIYEIETARKQEVVLYAIPYVTLIEKELSADGMMLYLEDAPHSKLDAKQSIYYAMARNIYEGGLVEVDKEVIKQKPTKIRKAENEKETKRFEINIKNKKLIEELETFVNQKISEGIDFFSTRDNKTVKIEGENSY